MGTDRRQHDGLEIGGQDRATGRQVVGRRAGGRRQDQPIGFVGRDDFALEPGLQVQQARHRRLADDRLVDGAPGFDGGPVRRGQHGHSQAHALVDRQLSRARRAQGAGCFHALKVGDEAQAAQIHPEQRNSPVGDQPSSVKESPVAPQHDQRVHGRGQAGLVHPGRAREGRSLLVAEKGPAVLLAKGRDQLDRQLTRLGLVPLQEKTKPHRRIIR